MEAGPGAVLVRPDAHVGRRADELPEGPEKALTTALATLLARA
ncbi:hypothetical protein [Pseudonocardia xishanensis]